MITTKVGQKTVTTALEINFCKKTVWFTGCHSYGFCKNGVNKDNVTFFASVTANAAIL